MDLYISRLTVFFIFRVSEIRSVNNITCPWSAYFNVIALAIFGHRSWKSNYLFEGVFIPFIFNSLVEESILNLHSPARVSVSRGKSLLFVQLARIRKDKLNISCSTFHFITVISTVISFIPSDEAVV